MMRRHCSYLSLRRSHQPTIAAKRNCPRCWAPTLFPTLCPTLFPTNVIQEVAILSQKTRLLPKLKEDGSFRKVLVLTVMMST
jgi:hypothetical protein